MGSLDDIGVLKDLASVPPFLIKAKELNSVFTGEYFI